MSDSRDQVEVLVLAAGRGERLGRGPKAFLALGGRTLLERAIDCMRPVARRVVVGVPEECVEHARRLCPDDVLVVPGRPRRLDTALALFRATTAPLIVQHDVVHPFVCAETVRQVIAAASARGAAMAVVAADAHVFSGASELERRVATGGGLWVARKPLAFARSALARALARGIPSAEDAGTAELLLESGQPIEPVPAPPWNIKLTTPEDWALARALVPLVEAGALR